MRRRRIALAFALAALGLGCEQTQGEKAGPIATGVAAAALSKARPFGEANGVRALAVPAEKELLPETDEVPLFDLVLQDRLTGDGRLIAQRLRSAAVTEGRLFAIRADGMLLDFGRLGAGRSPKPRLVIDRALACPAVLEDGSLVVPRLEGERGESDLWLVPKEGAPAPLAPAPGPDEHPIALGDRRVAFVSGRSSVASIWIADVTTGEAFQLTNRGLVAGKGLDESFVPPPAGDARVEAGALVYDDGSGVLWRVDLSSGEAARGMP